MPCLSIWTVTFYIFVLSLAILPVFLTLHFWKEARTREWNWINVDTRTMYVDGAKTMITASGIAVALLASSAVSTVRTANSLVGFSAKVAAVVPDFLRVSIACRNIGTSAGI